MNFDYKFRSGWSPPALLTTIILMSGCSESLLKGDLRGESTQIITDKSTTLSALKKAEKLPVILFSKGSTRLTTKARKQIREVVLLINHPDLINHLITVEGHSDTLGDAHTNLILSKQRAESVARELVISGIRSNRLTINARGERRPLMAEFTSDGQLNSEAARRNRRVEIILVRRLEAVATQP